MLCLSLTAATIEEIAELKQYDDLHIYDSGVPASLSSTHPQLSALADGTYTSGSGYKQLSTIGGNDFTAFAKNKALNIDLYQDLVQPTLERSFWWETWRHSGQDTMCAAATRATILTTP